MDGEPRPGVWTSWIERTETLYLTLHLEEEKIGGPLEIYHR